MATIRGGPRSVDTKVLTLRRKLEQAGLGEGGGITTIAPAGLPVQPGKPAGKLIHSLFTASKSQFSNHHQTASAASNWYVQGGVSRPMPAVLTELRSCKRLRNRSKRSMRWGSSWCFRFAAFT